MEIKLPQTAEELKAFLCDLDKVLLKKAMELARECYKSIAEELDDAIARYRDKGLTIEHRRAVWYQTCLGPVRVCRRQYHDGSTGYRYLLDELMVMKERLHLTAAVTEPVLELVAAMPYRRSADVLRKTSAIDLSHQTIWRIVGKTTDPYLKKAQEEIERFLNTGEMREGEGKKAARLMVEADGVMLSLQREKERKAEVKLGIAYEGWEKVGKAQKIGKVRYRTVNKTAFASIGGECDFWAGMSLKLATRYDFSKIEETIIGGDGASWVKEGAGYLNGRYQLDRYHLYKELTRSLGKDSETKSRVWLACERGDVEGCLRIMADAAGKAEDEQAEKICESYKYLKANESGLVDYRLALGEEGEGLRRTGAIEGNVDKLVARRMKNQGMSWTIKGIRSLLCIRFLVLEGKLTSSLLQRDDLDKDISFPSKNVRRIVHRSLKRSTDEWLQVHLPALRGPHASRPWTTALKTICEVKPL